MREIAHSAESGIRKHSRPYPDVRCTIFPNLLPQRPGIKVKDHGNIVPTSTQYLRPTKDYLYTIINR